MSEGVISRSLNSKQTHFKIQPKGFRNAEFGQQMCSVLAESKAFMSYLSTNYEIIQCLYTSYQVLVVISLTIKFCHLSEAIDFNYSARDYQQSGF